MEAIGYADDVDLNISEITALSARDEETGLVQVDLYDQQAIQAIMEVDKPLSEERMLAILAKVCALLHHNSGRAHETNQRIVKIQIKKKVDDIVQSYNGRAYIAFQVASGLINICGATVAAGGQHSIKFLGGVTDLSHYSPAKSWGGSLSNIGQRNVQRFVRDMNKMSKNMSQFTQVGASVADNSAQAGRTEGQGHKSLLDNDNQQGGQRLSNEQQTCSQQVQQVDRVWQQRNQAFQAIVR